MWDNPHTALIVVSNSLLYCFLEGEKSVEFVKAPVLIKFFLYSGKISKIWDYINVKKKTNGLVRGLWSKIV